MSMNLRNHADKANTMQQRANYQNLSDYDYQLPESLIAQRPTENRSDSRLLVLDEGSRIHDHRFKHLPQWLKPGDLIVVNNSSVLKARLIARKPSGGAAELLIERVIAPNRALAMIGSNKRLKIDQTLNILSKQGATVAQASIKERHDSLFVLDFNQDPFVLMQDHGVLPLPPYIASQADRDDATRYQTIYGQIPGSVAAPTAGLHFDQPMIDQLLSIGVEIASVTLHVGLGTFLPVRVEDIQKHRMHAEHYALSEDCAQAISKARQRGGRVIAVGTTALRTLESCADPTTAGHVLAQQGETRLFIRPGFRFKVCDALITNFHLPKSTLLMLVSAFAGFEAIRKAYAHAIDKQYRFFSYGDACLFFSSEGTDLR
jgi:S-adenosylmethionine:tRNA ribosyltransferase-isomerase